MVCLPLSIAAWPSSAFPAVLKSELEGIAPDALPLQAGLSTSSYAIGEGFSISLLSSGEAGDSIQATLGVFYAGITAGCSCADDPTPVEPVPEYCEVLLTIDKDTAQASFVLVDGQAG